MKADLSLLLLGAYIGLTLAAFLTVLAATAMARRAERRARQRRPRNLADYEAAKGKPWFSGYRQDPFRDPHLTQADR